MSTKISVSVLVHAAIEHVWECYTNPNYITKWNFADPSWHCPIAENDLTVGGKYFAKMEAKDCSIGFDFTAIYTSVITLKQLSYRMGDGREVITIFEQRENGTSVTTSFDAENENAIELQQTG